MKSKRTTNLQKDRVNQVIAQLRSAALKKYADSYQALIKNAQRLSNKHGIPEPYREQFLEQKRNSIEIFLIRSYCHLSESQMGIKVNDEVEGELESLQVRHTEKAIDIISQWIATDPDEHRTAEEIKRAFLNIVNTAAIKPHRISMKQIEKRATERRTKKPLIAAAMELGHNHFNAVCEELADYLELNPKQKDRPASNYSKVVDEYERIEATGQYSHNKIMQMLYKKFIRGLDQLDSVEANRLKKNLRQGMKDEENRREKNKIAITKIKNTKLRKVGS
jgi:hypothetical protein